MLLERRQKMAREPGRMLDGSTEVGIPDFQTPANFLNLAAFGTRPKTQSRFSFRFEH